MTTPSTTPAKKTTSPAKVTENKAEEVKETNSAPADRLPKELSGQAFLKDFCNQYLTVFDEITAYNKEVLASRDAEWTIPKVLEQARNLGNPTDANTPANETIKSALADMEKAQQAFNLARKAVIDATAKELNITLSVSAERDPAIEGPLKEKRKLAAEIGKQLDMMSGLTTDTATKEAVKTFLENHPLPAIGRDQVSTFGGEGTNTPRYRVQVIVTDKAGNEKVNVSGFTKASQSLTGMYERGKQLKADDLRAVWEKAGNTPDNTVQNSVKFEDNGYLFEIRKN